MNLSAPFIARPVATTLLTIAIALAGALGYFELPVSPLPQVDFPTIRVTAQLPGASPDVVATSLAAPLERHLAADRRRDRTDVYEQYRAGADRSPVRARQEHHRRRAGRAGRHQCRPGGSADEPAVAADLPESESGRCAGDDPVADLEDADARPDVRRREQRADAAAFAAFGRRPGHHRRRRAAGGARRIGADATLALRHRSGGYPVGALEHQRERAQRRHRHRRPSLADLYQRSGQSRRRLSEPRRRVSQWRSVAAEKCG